MRFTRDDARIAGGAALLFAASFVIYWPAIHGAFLWDDLINIVANPLIQRNRGLLEIWLGGAYVYDYYPVTWTTWWLEWRAWRRDTTGYHVLNIILHAGAASMLWRVLVRLALPGAFVAALIFAVHPINVESVAWISERKNTLSMFLLAITLALYLDSDSATDPRRRRRFYWASVIGFALTLLAKPSVVMLPGVLLLVAWWRRGRIGRRDLWASVPFFVLSAAISVVTIVVHHGRSIVTSEIRTDGFFSRLVGAGWAVWFYLYKLFWPAELSFVYPRWNLNPTSVLHWVPLMALLLVLLAIYLARGRVGRGPVVALASYVALLFPVLGFIDVYFMRFSFVSDHWQYPACLAVIAPVVAGACLVLRRMPERIGDAAGGVLATGVCAALAVLAWQEAHFYRSHETLWGEVLRDNPKTMLAWTNYGTVMWANGQTEEARKHYAKAIELDPRSREPYVAMGNTYLQNNQPRKAIEWYQKALGRPGGGLDPRIYLADALLADGSPVEAIRWYEEALADDPWSAKFRPQLAALHADHGRPERALELYREDTRYWPEQPEAWFFLGSAARRYGHDEDANAAFDKARRLSASDHVTLNGMGTRLLAVGYFQDAAEMLTAAIRANPNYGPAHNNLGKAMEGMNRLPEAAAAFQEALRVQPGFYEARLNLERVQEAMTQQASPASSQGPPSAVSP